MLINLLNLFDVKNLFDVNFDFGIGGMLSVERERIIDTIQLLFDAVGLVLDGAVTGLVVGLLNPFGKFGFEFYVDALSFELVVVCFKD